MPPLRYLLPLLLLLATSPKASAQRLYVFGYDGLHYSIYLGELAPVGHPSSIWNPRGPHGEFGVPQTLDDGTSISTLWVYGTPNGPDGPYGLVPTPATHPPIVIHEARGQKHFAGFLTLDTECENRALFECALYLYSILEKGLPYQGRGPHFQMPELDPERIADATINNMRGNGLIYYDDSGIRVPGYYPDPAGSPYTAHPGGSEPAQSPVLAPKVPTRHDDGYGSQLPSRTRRVQRELDRGVTTANVARDLVFRLNAGAYLSSELLPMVVLAADFHYRMAPSEAALGLLLGGYARMAALNGFCADFELGVIMAEWLRCSLGIGTNNGGTRFASTFGLVYPGYHVNVDLNGCIFYQNGIDYAFYLTVGWRLPFYSRAVKRRAGIQ